MVNGYINGTDLKEQIREALPMTTLLRSFGIDAQEGRNFHSFLRDGDRSPSMSILPGNQAVYDHGTAQRLDIYAVARHFMPGARYPEHLEYCGRLAGIAAPSSEVSPRRVGKPAQAKRRERVIEPSFREAPDISHIWDNEYRARLTDEACVNYCKVMGGSPLFLQKWRDVGEVGMSKDGHLCEPVRDETGAVRLVHIAIRDAEGKRLSYPYNPKGYTRDYPKVTGPIVEKGNYILTESESDERAIAELVVFPGAVKATLICTRGSGNTRHVRALNIPPKSRALCFTQNDDPAKHGAVTPAAKWLKELREALDCEVFDVRLPSEFNGSPIKDIRDALKAGASTADVIGWMNAAVQVPKPEQNALVAEIPQNESNPLFPVLLPPEEVVKEMYGLFEGERGEAEMLAIVGRNRAAWDTTNEVWLWCEDGIWRTDLPGTTIAYGQQFLRDTLLAASVCEDRKIVQSIASGGTDDQDAAKKVREELRSRARNIQGRHRASQVMASLRTLPGMAHSEGEMDCNQSLFAAANGTLDLTGGITFRETRACDLITKQSPVTYDPSATCPKWEACLTQILPDPEFRQFMQVLCGYTLTGSKSDQSIYFPYGPGANGKTLFFSTIKEILGPYAKSVDVEVFLTRPQRDSTTMYEMAGLRGARAVICSEIPSGRKLNETLVKSWSGDDPINARNPYGRPFSYMPCGTLFLVGNHRPTITGADGGIWRRVKLLPFEAVIPPERRRPMPEMMREFRAEMSGILNWMLKGWELYLRNGLEAPGCVKAATETYRQEEDVLGPFLDECITPNPGSREKVSDIFVAYSRFCENRKERPAFANVRTFTAALRERTDRAMKIAKGTGNATMLFDYDLIEPQSSY